MPLVRARSKSVNGSIVMPSTNGSAEENSKKATAQLKPETNDEMGSSILMSSYGEAASECEINDSRFNDISCISYTDRIVDEKDNSSGRFDVSSKADVQTVNTSNSSLETNKK